MKAGDTSHLPTYRSAAQRPMNSLQLAWAIFTEPAAAFDALERQPRFWFALLVPAALSVAVFLWYFGVVDFPWLTEQMLSAHPKFDEMSEADKRDAAQLFTREVMLWSSVASLGLGVPLLRVLEAAYYSLAGKLTNVQHSFRHWLALAAWSSFPAVLISVAMVLPLLLTDNGQVTMEGLNPLSLNELLFNVPRSSEWHTLLTTLTVLHPWMWWLGVRAVQAWSGRGAGFSSAFALAPVVAVYGAWTLFILL
ncbi:YIP1 family protein [Eleftheria terrae]|uniref:YIP1 family protein n=1 Tax=Eleftheria terrae TaxID=1597781 RepID=UPI00263B09A4|nr:YIP1 family protein [Eleftheria terrae]WKB55706.1 YIP1 family protein [Eleftheria terrae]